MGVDSDITLDTHSYNMFYLLGLAFFALIIRQKEKRNFEERDLKTKQNNSPLGIQMVRDDILSLL